MTKTEAEAELTKAIQYLYDNAEGNQWSIRACPSKFLVELLDTHFLIVVFEKMTFDKAVEEILYSYGD